MYSCILETVLGILRWILLLIVVPAVAIFLICFGGIIFSIGCMHSHILISIAGFLGTGTGFAVAISAILAQNR